MLDTSHINYWAVLVAAVINIIVGAFWYSPAGFGKTWSKLTGIDMMKMPKDTANQAMGITALTAVIQSVVLAIIVHSLGLTTFGKGLELGFLVWLGFTGATTVSDTLYARRGWKFWAITSGFYLLVLIVNSVIFSLWR